MALAIGNMITAAQAKAMLSSNTALTDLKIQLHQTIRAAAPSVTNLIFNVPKSISATAVPALETEGYAVTRIVLPSGGYDQLILDWSAA